MKYVYLFIIISISGEAYSQCNFKTGDYIEDLTNPSSISLIKIDIPKSSKYAANAIKIITSNSVNIPPKLRKKFKANISVHYKFGICKYSGSVRQSGDLKDHLGFKDGKIIRSLDVKLHKGNIINAVKFKLLLSSSRNGLNEILGVAVLKDLGFLAPDTFEVNTMVNGVSSSMIFQEKITKELLEKNNRREGPLFKGDESLIWQHKEFQNSELAPLSLSVLINDNWLRKGLNAHYITLKAYTVLQKAHLKNRYERINRPRYFHIFPNELKNNIYTDLYNVLYAMNGLHAMAPNNRKHYYNSIEMIFEPIYYDGDLLLTKTVFFEKPDYLPPIKITNSMYRKIKTLNTNNDLFNYFSDRVLNKKESSVFFYRALSQFKSNINAIKNNKQIGINRMKYLKQATAPAHTEWYHEFQKVKNLDYQTIEKISLGNDLHEIKLNDKSSMKINSDELSKILSKNKLNNKRITFIPSYQDKKISKDMNIKELKIHNSHIYMTKGIVLNINYSSKVLELTQSSHQDWVLISDGDFSDWDIIFTGVSTLKNLNKTSYQRFNKYGLTGCLTFYKTNLNRTSLLATGGKCEDSINFIRVVGNDINLSVKNAFSDAIDADFSHISFNKINIKHAENDCLDVSGGTYAILYAELDSCYDKAISVGEKSRFLIDTVSISDSDIGISSKDQSIVKIDNVRMTNVNICAEVKQKKQEFSGAYLTMQDTKCLQPISIDSQSRFVK